MPPPPPPPPTQPAQTQTYTNTNPTPTVPTQTTDTRESYDDGYSNLDKDPNILNVDLKKDRIDKTIDGVRIVDKVLGLPEAYAAGIEMGKKDKQARNDALATIDAREAVNPDSTQAQLQARAAAAANANFAVPAQAVLTTIFNYGGNPAANVAAGIGYYDGYKNCVCKGVAKVINKTNRVLIYFILGQLAFAIALIPLTDLHARFYSDDGSVLLGVVIFIVTLIFSYIFFIYYFFKRNIFSKLAILKLIVFLFLIDYILRQIYSASDATNYLKLFCTIDSNLMQSNFNFLVCKYRVALEWFIHSIYASLIPILVMEALYFSYIKLRKINI